MIDSKISVKMYIHIRNAPRFQQNVSVRDKIVSPGYAAIWNENDSDGPTAGAATSWRSKGAAAPPF